MSEAKSEVFQVEIAAPIRRVWEEVTALNLLRRFYMDTVAEGELRPGSPLRYRSQDGRRTFIVGEIVEVTPPRRFVHTFRFTRMSDPPTTVIWSLEETAAGTRVTIRHDGLEAAPKTGRMIRGGWRMVLRNLQSLIETGRLPLSTRIKYVLMKATLALTPGKEKWEQPAGGAPPR